MLAYDATRDALYQPYLRPTVLVAAHGEVHPPAKAKWVDLLLAAEASRLAYWPFERDLSRRTELRQALGVVGFHHWKPFSAPQTGSQGYGAWRERDGLVLLAFRGTQPDELADLAHDLAFAMTPWAAGRAQSAQVHHGFADATHSLQDQVIAWLASLGGQRKRLLMTGHSLGAAIATLMSTLIQPKPDLLVTLGSPRVGDAGLVRLMHDLQIQHTRLVDACDLVTEVPPRVDRLHLPFEHVCNAAYIHADDGALISWDVDTEVSTTIRQERHTARDDYLLHQAWRRGHVLMRDLADHAPINYVRACLQAYDQA